MSVTTTSLKQFANYQQSNVQSRKIELSSNQIKQTDSQQGSDEIKLTTIEIDHQSLQTSQLSKNVIVDSLKEQDLTTQEDVYSRPQSAKVYLMRLILEGHFKVTFDLSDKELHLATSQNSLSSINELTSLNSEQTELVNIDGQQFASQEMLSVEQWQTHTQSLSYQMQGEFELDDEVHSINYTFTLDSEHTSYSKFEMTAAALKDPLIVQFSKQSIGNITATTEFDINQDKTLNTLPIFSGDVGYLVFDKNANGVADNGSELFGPQTGNGFNELSQLDSNNNGFIDEDDQAFKNLYIWQPENNNQQTQWLSLQQADIKAISTTAIATPFSFYDQNNELSAQLTKSSFAISSSGQARGVHQLDVRI